MKDRNLSIRPLSGRIRLIHGLLFFVEEDDEEETKEEDVEEEEAAVPEVDKGFLTS